MPSLSQKCFAELIGTFFLVFAGTGAIVIDQQTQKVTHLGIALTFGVVVFIAVETLGPISGSHLNPAVSIAFVLAGRFPFRLFIPYFLSQLTGALLASILLRLLFPENLTLGATLPSGSVLQSFIFEMILTWFLMLVVLITTSRQEPLAPILSILIGSIIGLEALFAGPICGASMNPTRSFAPAAISGTWQHLWLYLTAPTLGAILAIPTAKMLRTR